MTAPNHYQTLEINHNASHQEIKQAYRRLAKQFHPDSNNHLTNHDRIIIINAAYEILGDPQRRQRYDQELYSDRTRRQQRTTEVQRQYQHHRQSSRETDTYLEKWLREIYTPINRLISPILNSLESEIDVLAADPFDDNLMADFQNYLAECVLSLKQAQTIFASQPNPAKLASAAASLYYCLNQISDGLEQLEWFTLNYDDHYLHTGQELFRIARSLRYEAQQAARTFAQTVK
jgi:molecular chaperone DnaJ